MPSPTVTTIIPAYRATRTIGRALESVLGQSCPPDEVLVVDDGSPDDIAAAVRPFGSRVTLLRKPNGGAASARNLGLDRARGELVAFLDADDYWVSHKLEQQLAILRTHTAVGLTASRWFTLVPPGPPVAPQPDTGPTLDQVVTVTGEQAFALATRVLTSTVVVRREVIGTHRFPLDLQTAEDRDLWVRLVTAAPVYLTSEPLITYVEEAGSLSRSHVDQDYGNMLRLVHRYHQLLGPGGVRRWEADTFRRWAARHLGNGHPRAAWKPAWKRLLRQPVSLESWWVLLKTGLAAAAA